jgi:hypothetical protein
LRLARRSGYRFCEPGFDLAQPAFDRVQALYERGVTLFTTAAIPRPDDPPQNHENQE